MKDSFSGLLEDGPCSPRTPYSVFTSDSATIAGNGENDHDVEVSYLARSFYTALTIETIQQPPALALRWNMSDVSYVSHEFTSLFIGYLDCDVYRLFISHATTESYPVVASSSERLRSKLFHISR